MRYFLLRFQVYQHSIKTAVAALAELLTFLMMVLYLAIPAMAFTALISLSVIEDINESVAVQAQYQGLYLAITYLYLRIQKRAILGGDNQYYFATLHVSLPQKGLSTAIITLIAGNLPLLMPTYLLSYITSYEQLIQHSHFALFAITVLFISLYCVLRSRPPILTLLFVLIVAFIPEVAALFNHLFTFNMALLSMLIAEFLLQKQIERHSLSTIKVQTKAYWQLRAIYISRTPSTFMMRLLLACVFIGLVAFMQMKLSQVADFAIQQVCYYVVALLIGSFQFEHQTFKAKYHYYLALAHISLRRCLLQETVVAILGALFFSYLMVIVLEFSLWGLVILPTMTLITDLSVVKMNKSFFIPSAFLTLVLVVLNL